VVYDPVLYIDKHANDNEKLRILTGKWVSPASFSFPVTANGRRYNIQWEKEYKWLWYSISKNAAYYIYCILFGNNFAKQGGNNVLAFHTSGFTDWKNARGEKRGALPLHEASESHKDAAMKALSFKDVCDGRLKDIRYSTSAQHDEQAMRNREVLLSIIDGVIALGWNIPFQGHSWGKALHREDRNFDYFVHWKAEFDDSLAKHLWHCKKN